MNIEPRSCVYPRRRIMGDSKMTSQEAYDLFYELVCSCAEVGSFADRKSEDHNKVMAYEALVAMAEDIVELRNYVDVMPRKTRTTWLKKAVTS